MACRPHYWLYGLPFLAALGVGAYMMKKDSIEADLTARSKAAIAAGEGAFSDGKPWGSVAINGRDALLTGTSPAAIATSSLKARVDAVSGVRLVEDTASLLPEAKPFAWSVSKTAAGLTLAGLVGAAGERGKILSALGTLAPGLKIDDKMTLARGLPECSLAGAATASSAIMKLISGEASLNDCTLSVKGAAASQEIKASVEAGLKTLTGGLKLGDVSISAPVPPPPPTLPPVVAAPPPPPPVIDVVVPISPAPMVMPVIPPVVVAAPPPPPPPPVVAPPAPPPINHVKICSDLIKSATGGNFPRFNVDSANLDRVNFGLLQGLSVAMKQCHASVKFELSGHTDSTANPAYNDVLSQNRVKAVALALTKYGVDATKMMQAAKGEGMPLAPNTNAANMALNRRVEITPR